MTDENSGPAPAESIQTTAGVDSTSAEALSNRSALSAELYELLSVVEPGSVANMIVQRAYSYGATDIHLDPTSGGLRVRMRVDGDLHDVIPIPAEKSSILISRIKVMAGMDITDRRLPQDGSITAKDSQGLIRDVRVGSSPTIHGERLVMRLMPDPDELNTIDSLGLFEDQRGALRQLASSPYGLVLVVGPVGSGKSTTVYSMLSELNVPNRSVVTIEDPVERQIHGLNQIQVDARGELNFARALRGILRQDPNVISIGEIRDAETAHIACRAATTGVLVLSTLHASNTATAIDVLRNFGVSSRTISDCLRGVVSQRLVRKIDPENREMVQPTNDEARVLGIEANSEVKIARGLPTAENFQTGYSGRIAIFETLLMNAGLREVVGNDAAAYQIHERARTLGMATLADAGIRRVLDGTTSVSELERLIGDIRMRGEAENE